eukprot:1347895-Alexandrium_andersonii.AAC.1
MRIAGLNNDTPAGCNRAPPVATSMKQGMVRVRTHLETTLSMPTGLCTRVTGQGRKKPRRE